MRVLFITGEFPPMQGGVGDCTNEIARTLAAMGAHVCVLTSKKAISDNLRSSSIVLRPIIEIWNWSSASIIRETIREFSPDVVHIQFQIAAFGMHPLIYFSPILFSRANREVKSVITFHDLRPPYLFPKAGPLRDWMTRTLALGCDAVIATNEEDFLKLAMWNLKPRLIPIGSNIPNTQPSNNAIAELRNRMGITANETLLSYFGFLNESKGGETLIRALARVPNAKLLMIGGQVGASDPTNIAYLARVQALIDELDLRARVIWTDYAPQEIVSAYFFAADLCVLPYRDGASFRRGTLMAALAHGMAIITTKDQRRTTEKIPVFRPSSSVNELPQLIDEENCLLVEPDDPRALADAIQRAAHSRALREKIRAGARELAQNFTWDSIARQHWDLYWRLMG